MSKIRSEFSILDVDDVDNVVVGGFQIQFNISKCLLIVLIDTSISELSF